MMFGVGLLGVVPLPPTSLSVTMILATTDSGATNLNAGHVVTISLSLNETAYVSGNPFLLLNDNEVATYTTGSGTGNLTFTYTVASGDNPHDQGVWLA